MIRILHVFGRLDLGGAESRIMDLYRHIDRECVQFDFVEHTNDRCFYEEEIESLGGRIYHLPRYKVSNHREYISSWEKLFDEHKKENGDSEFKMVQGHMTSTAAMYLPIAKNHGVKVTIAHARSAGVDKGIKGYLTRFLRRNLADNADYLFACSYEAGISVFGKKAQKEGKIRFVPNAINCVDFAFDIDKRRKIRKELEIEDKFVIGHVGRFHYAKNHEYLLAIMRDLLEDYHEGMEKEPVLILLGEGPKMAEMKALAIEYGIEKNVRFLGNHKDVYNYYQAMDYFVYPSRYEGLPGTVVEAQASGLKVLMSDTICKEVMVTSLVEIMSIKADSDEWARKVIDDIKNDRLCSTIRGDFNEETIKAGFDVNEQAKTMKEFYCNE